MSDPLPLSPETEAGRRLLAFLTPPRGGTGDLASYIIAIEQEARTLARTLDVDVLAGAIHRARRKDAGPCRGAYHLCSVDKHASEAAAIADAYAAALSRLGERE